MKVEVQVLVSRLLERESGEDVTHPLPAQGAHPVRPDSGAHAHLECGTGRR